MKCEYCMGTLSLEDEYCPHCGQPNKHAKQHIKDMKRYQSEFENTRQYVYEKAGRYTDTTVRVIVIAILIVLIMATFLIGANSWSIRSSWQSASANRHYAKYSEIMDQYLAEEDYLGFNTFCNENYIRSYEEPYREKYCLVMQIAGSYSTVQDALLYYCFLEDEDYSEQAVDRAADALDYFYRYYLNEDDSYTDLYGESENFEQAASVMEYNIEQMLVAYGNFTQEEAATLPTLSKTKKAVLLEEKLEEKMQNE